MKFLHIWAMGLISLFAPATAFAAPSVFGTILPGYSEPPAAEAYFHFTSGDLIKVYSDRDSEQCSSMAYVYGPINPDGISINHIEYRTTEYWTGLDSPLKSVNCLGEKITVNTTDSEAIEIMRRILSRPIPLNTVRGPYVGGRIEELNSAHSCLFVFRIRYGKGWQSVIQVESNFNNAAPYECSSGYTPTPVACYAHTPDSIIHAPANIGSVRSTANGSLWVSCSEKTQITVSVADTSMELLATNGRISSNLYVGENGKRTTRATATPYATVPLISTIDSNASHPGVYQGSKVITVAWD